MYQANNGLEIKITRIRSGLKQYELAAKLGINQARLSEIETGRREATPELAQKIIEVIKEGKKCRVLMELGEGFE